MCSSLVVRQIGVYLCYVKQLAVYLLSLDGTLGYRRLTPSRRYLFTHPDGETFCESTNLNLYWKKKNFIVFEFSFVAKLSDRCFCFCWFPAAMASPYKSL